MEVTEENKENTEPSQSEAPPTEGSIIENMNQGVSADPVEMAAMLYSMYHKRFVSGIASLSGNAAKRILTHLILDKLVDNTIKHPTQLENDCFHIGDRLLEAKYIMILHTFMEAASVSMEEKFKTEEKKEEVKDGV